jgi:hypothetical protein
MSFKINITSIGKTVIEHGLGCAVDILIQPQNIIDPVLAGLWADAQVKLNEIQLHLETRLGSNFFNGGE